MMRATRTDYIHTRPHREDEEAEGEPDQYPQIAEEEKRNDRLAQQLKNAQHCLWCETMAEQGACQDEVDKCVPVQA